MVRFKKPVKGAIRGKGARSEWVGPATVEGSTRNQHIQIRYESRKFTVAKRNVRALPHEALPQTELSKFPRGKIEDLLAQSSNRKRRRIGSESPEHSEYYLEQQELDRFIEKTSLPSKYSRKVSRIPIVTTITKISSPVHLPKPSKHTNNSHSLGEGLSESTTSSPIAEVFTCSPEAERSQVDFVLIGDAEAACQKNDFSTKLSTKREPS